METTRKYLFLLLCLPWLLVACGIDSDVQQIEETPTLIVGTEPVPSLTPSLTPTPPPTPTLTATPQSIVYDTFRVDRHSVNERRGDEDLTLSVRSVTFAEAETVFEVGFDNNTNRLYNLRSDELNNRFFRLLTPSGSEYEATALTAELSTMTPPDGIPPGASNIGRITFPPLTEVGEYQLHFATEYGYQPLSFAVTQLTAVSDTSPVAQLAEGHYPLQLDVYSHEESFVPLRLHIDSVTVTADMLTFDVHFTNDGIYNGYRIIPSPTGYEAWLIDNERRAHAPSAVSDSLMTTITGEEGLALGAIYAGSISFPIIAGLDGSTFIFNHYEPVRLTRTDSGLSAEVTTFAGGDPLPPPTPAADIRAYETLQTLLQQQCAAIIAGDVSAYLHNVNDAHRESQETFVTQLLRLPVAECTLSIHPDSYVLSGAEHGNIRNLDVLLQLTHEGVTDNNPFLFRLRFSFAQADEWRIIETAYTRDAPVWTLPDTLIETTEHFYVLASAELASSMPDFKQEVEDAYAFLDTNNAPVEGKYIAYFATTSEFRQITRAFSAGVAPYATFSERAHVPSNRMFFVDAEAGAESYGGQIMTTKHELVHVVMTEHERPAVPEWFTEGIAEYFSGNFEQRRESADLRQLQNIDVTWFTQLREIGNDNDRYTFAGLFVAFLAETYGEDAVLDFFYRFSALPYDETQFEHTLPLTEQFAQAYFGESLEMLDQLFKAWLNR